MLSVLPVGNRRIQCKLLSASRGHQSNRRLAHKKNKLQGVPVRTASLPPPIVIYLLEYLYAQVSEFWDAWKPDNPQTRKVDVSKVGLAANEHHIRDQRELLTLSCKFQSSRTSGSLQTPKLVKLMFQKLR